MSEDGLGDEPPRFICSSSIVPDVPRMLPGLMELRGAPTDEGEGAGDLTIS